MDPNYACSKHDMREQRAQLSPAAASGLFHLHFIYKSDLWLFAWCLHLNCQSSMHTRPKCSSNCLRHRLHGTSEAELRQFVSDAFLFYFICKRLRWSVKPLPPLCSTSLHWMEQAIIYVLYWAEGVIFLWETRSERPINATRHQQEAAQINISSSIICLSKFCLSFCLSSIPGGYPRIYTFPVKTAMNNNYY